MNLNPKGTRLLYEKADVNASDVKTAVYTYTIKDADGDTSQATLTVTVTLTLLFTWMGCSALSAAVLRGGGGSDVRLEAPVWDPPCLGVVSSRAIQQLASRARESPTGEEAQSGVSWAGAQVAPPQACATQSASVAHCPTS
jgi:hypothetical protein